jgi:hypothetical protein
MSLKEFPDAIACPGVVLEVNLFEFLIISHLILCYLGFLCFLCCFCWVFVTFGDPSVISVAYAQKEQRC